MAISKEEIKHIAKLSKLKIDEQSIEDFAKTFDKVIEFISTLKEVDIEDIEQKEVGHINGEKNNWRNDEREECSEETKKALLKEVPEKKDRYIKVPGVLEAK